MPRTSSKTCSARCNASPDPRGPLLLAAGRAPAGAIQDDAEFVNQTVARVRNGPDLPKGSLACGQLERGFSRHPCSSENGYFQNYAIHRMRTPQMRPRNARWAGSRACAPSRGAHVKGFRPAGLRHLATTRDVLCPDANWSVEGFGDCVYQPAEEQPARLLRSPGTGLRDPSPARRSGVQHEPRNAMKKMLYYIVSTCFYTLH